MRTFRQQTRRWGEMVATAVEKVGKDGLVTVEEGKGFESEVGLYRGDGA